MTRPAQIAIGTFFALTGVALLVIPFLVTGEEPSKLFLGAGVGISVLGLVVAFPITMEGFAETVGELVPQLGESAEDDE